MWLLYPPDVAGWDGGQAWVSTATMVERMRWSERLFRGYPVRSLVPSASADQIVDRFIQVLDAPANETLKGAMAEAAKKGLAKNLQTGSMAAARLLFSSPAYQMG
jgi:uncharacterized protein (DUF1800 family)